jgi:hypothetical protein
MDDRVALVHGEKVVAGLDCLRIFDFDPGSQPGPNDSAQSISLRQFPQARVRKRQQTFVAVTLSSSFDVLDATTINRARQGCRYCRRRASVLS